jgi:hypothetical protein
VVAMAATLVPSAGISNNGPSPYAALSAPLIPEELYLLSVIKDRRSWKMRDEKKGSLCHILFRNTESAKPRKWCIHSPTVHALE